MRKSEILSFLEVAFGPIWGAQVAAVVCISLKNGKNAARDFFRNEKTETSCKIAKLPTTPSGKRFSREGTREHRTRFFGRQFRAVVCTSCKKPKTGKVPAGRAVRRNARTGRGGLGGGLGTQPRSKGLRDQDLEQGKLNTANYSDL